MLSIVPKWKVSVEFADREVHLWLYDHHLSNVLDKVAGMQFTENGLEQPIRVIVGPCDPMPPNVTATTTFALTCTCAGNPHSSASCPVHRYPQSTTGAARGAAGGAT